MIDKYACALLCLIEPYRGFYVGKSTSKLWSFDERHDVRLEYILVPKHEITGAFMVFTSANTANFMEDEYEVVSVMFDRRSLDLHNICDKLYSPYLPIEDFDPLKDFAIVPVDRALR